MAIGVVAGTVGARATAPRASPAERTSARTPTSGGTGGRTITSGSRRDDAAPPDAAPRLSVVQRRMSRNVRREVDPELRLHPLRHPLGEPRDGVPEPCLHGGPAVAETIPETPGPFRAENEQVDAGQPLDQRANGIGHDECHRAEASQRPRRHALDEALIGRRCGSVPRTTAAGPYRLPVPDDEVDRSGRRAAMPATIQVIGLARSAAVMPQIAGTAVATGWDQAGDELRRQEPGACDHRHEGGSDLEDRRDQHGEGQDKWPGDPRCQSADGDHRRPAEQIDQRLDRLDTPPGHGPRGMPVPGADCSPDRAVR